MFLIPSIFEYQITNENFLSHFSSVNHDEISFINIFIFFSNFLVAFCINNNNIYRYFILTEVLVEQGINPSKLNMCVN